MFMTRIFTYVLLAFAAVFLMDSEASPPIEHMPEDRFMYFTAVDGPHSFDIEMEQGEREIMVAMDNGELWLRLSRGEKNYLDTDATFSADYAVQIDETGTYTLTMIGKHASGSINY